MLKEESKEERENHWIRPGRTDLWWGNMIKERSLNGEKNFRMSKENFMELADELESCIAPRPRWPRPAAAKKHTQQCGNDEFVK